MSSNLDDDDDVLFNEGGSDHERPEDGGADRRYASSGAAQELNVEIQGEDQDEIPRLVVEDLEHEDEQALPDADTTAPKASELEDGKSSPYPDERGSSMDDVVSIPDDTPSLRESQVSSPRSETPSSLSPGRHGSPSAALHRPFDRRFQSRLSSSLLLPTRSSSPAFLATHSRQSSITSLPPQTLSEPDESTAPWEVIRWIKLGKLSGKVFSEIGKRNFGTPTCLAVTDQIVIGTSKGMILVFDHQQNHKSIIGAGTKALESGAVTTLAISADHTTIAAGHSTGHIFTWEIMNATRPFLHITPLDLSDGRARKADGHVAGSSVVHIGFLGYRHTALVSADDKGMAFSHLATRGMGAVGRVVKTTRVLGRYPEVVSRTAKPLKKSSVLAFSPLPLGNIEQRTDALGLVAMMTPYLLVIVSTTPIAQTQHKAARPKEVAAHSAMTAALAWFPAIKLRAKDAELSRTKLAYAWSNILCILDVHEAQPVGEADKEKPLELQFLPRSRFKAEEAIVAMQWLSRSVLAVLTITQQLLILEDSVSMNITDSFDLLQRNIYHADLYSQQLQAVIENIDEEDVTMHGVVADGFHMSFRAYKGRLFLLGFKDLWWGSLTNWADRLLALINIGDFIGAIRLATRYYAGQGEKATIGLPEDAATRSAMVEEKLTEMMSASLRYAFGKNQQAGTGPVEESQMVELAEACIAACLTTSDLDFLFEEVFNWYYEHDQGPMFVDLLEPYIQDERITSLPPLALKTLIDHFAATHLPAKLEEIICLLDTSTMDIDQVTSLCKKYNLYDAYIYVWNKALHDFISPLEELLQLGAELRVMNGHVATVPERIENSQKLFPYMSFILTGRTYPTGARIEDPVSDNAKSQIYDFFFSANSDSAMAPDVKGQKTRPYSRLKQILHYDAPNFMSALNEAFEDSFLNSGDEEEINGVTTKRSSTGQKPAYNRQYIVRILLEVMSSGFEPEETFYLDMFIARNLPKYPQYMLLSGTALQEIFARLCRYPDSDMREDAQLSVEYLLSVWHPSNVLAFVPLLENAKFYRVLKVVFKQEREYPRLLQTFFVDQEDRAGIFEVLLDVLRSENDLSIQQHDEVVDIVQEHALDLCNIDIRKTASTIDAVAESLHSAFLQTLKENPSDQYEYLNTLFEPDASPSQKRHEITMLERYVQLMCQFNPIHVPDFVETVKEGDLRLEEVIPALERSEIIDAAIILQVRQGQVRDAMTRLSMHFASLKATLKGILSTEQEAADFTTMDEAIADLLASISKYSRVGIWLCQGQSKISQRSKTAARPPKRTVALAGSLSFEETLWLELIASVIAIARETSESLVTPTKDERADRMTWSLRNDIQQVFTALLTATTASRESSSGTSDLTFLRVLRAFLTQAAEASPSLSELRNVISSIFSAYAYEESLLSLSNAMLDKDVFVSIDQVGQMRQRGWRPRGQICEVCRRRVWGPGISNRIWSAWEAKEEERKGRRFDTGQENPMNDEGSRGKGKAAVQQPQNVPGDDEVSSTTEPALGPIVVFSCRHLYHQRCLGTGHQDEEAGENGASQEATQMTCPACA